MLYSRSFLGCFVLFSLLGASILAGGCGGGSGGGSGSVNPDLGDPYFLLQDVYYGRPLLDKSGMVHHVLNPASLVETDPITRTLLDGYPKSLFPGESLDKLHSFNIGNNQGYPYKPPVIPRNAAVVLEFSRDIDPACMNLDLDGHTTEQSPIQIVYEDGMPVPVQVLVEKDKVILNPVAAGNIGFPASPVMVDPEGHYVSHPEGFLRIVVYSIGTSLNVVKSTASKMLVSRHDLFASPAKPLGFNPGNAKLDFMNYGDYSFNGCLPDITRPRIIREVRHEGTVGEGSGFFIVKDEDPEVDFNVDANQGAGEWADAWLTVRPGDDSEERVKVLYNTSDTLHLAKGLVNPPVVGEDPYLLQRAEYFEPIPDLVDLTTAIDPENHPKDPMDPEDALNSDLGNFIQYDAWDEGEKKWLRQDYPPGPGGNEKIHPKWRITLRFSEPMDVSSFRPFESFYVCEAVVPKGNPAFDVMKPGRISPNEFHDVVSFEPVVENQWGGEHTLLGFGGKSKTIRFVIRVVPSRKEWETFILSLGDPPTWPDGVIGNLEEYGVLGVMDLGGRTLGFPHQFLNKNHSQCVAYMTSSGYGAFPPAADLSHEFSTENTNDPECGVLVHRFMGLPTPEDGGTPQDPISGLVFNDHEDMIYGPHLADTSIGLNGYLSGHAVEFMEHVFDEYNLPQPPYIEKHPKTGEPLPDQFKGLPSGVGTPITSKQGCRFQHVYRQPEASPEHQAYKDTILDLIGLAWAPIGGNVTTTTIENISIALSYSDIIPWTYQEAGVPKYPDSGLTNVFNKNIAPYTQSVVVGDVVPGGPDNGVSYLIDQKNIYKPKNAGTAYCTYHAWPAFDKPEGTPGFGYDSTPDKTLLIEYRIDPNLVTGLSAKNGFTYCPGVLSSLDPRFRAFTRGSPGNLVFASSYPENYPIATGPATNGYGDNSRYFMIFHYVKRISSVYSPFLKGEIGIGTTLDFLTPVVTPPVTNIPPGTSLDVTFQVSTNPENPSAHSAWKEIQGVEEFNSGAAADNDYIRFLAVFQANVNAGTLPAIDTLVIPYVVK